MNTKKLTVKELIEILQKYDENLIASMDCGDWGGAVTSVDQDEWHKERGMVELHSDE